MPDSDRTPGATNPDVTQANIDETICVAGWSQTVRPSAAYTNALKVVQIVQYGYDDKNPTHYEEDHLIPLSLGGAPKDKRNLWPEPRTATLPDGTDVSAEAKDGLELYLREEVCALDIPLIDAQRAFAMDWITTWEAAGRP